jgi:hypothetical protein
MSVFFGEQLGKGRKLMISAEEEFGSGSLAVLHIANGTSPR